MIIQNEAKCRKCEDIIWSAHRHDFKQCKCGVIAVDGGMDYIRRVGEPEDIEERSLSTDKNKLLQCVDSVSKTLVDKIVVEPKSPTVFFVVCLHYSIQYDLIEESKKQSGIKAVQWGIETGRNSFGIVLAVIRSLRDNDILDMSQFNNDEK